MCGIRTNKLHALKRTRRDFITTHVEQQEQLNRYLCIRNRTAGLFIATCAIWTSSRHPGRRLISWRRRRRSSWRSFRRRRRFGSSCRV